MKRPRFTVRRLMIAVAIVGVVLGVTIERHSRFRKIEAHHQAEFQRIASEIPMFAVNESYDPLWRRLDWHERMRLKYARATYYPWLPVAPDRPEPK
jgi:hypothetical protein